MPLVTAEQLEDLLHNFRSTVDSGTALKTSL